MNARTDSLQHTVDHDVAPGPLKRCQITGSENLNLVIDLGHQPPCDNLPDLAGLDQPERTFPLRLFHCPDSGLAQLDYAIDGRELYPPSYPYRGGISWPVVVHHKELAATIVGRIGANARTLCVDIGSNDGTLLAQFKTHGVRVLGVEPTDIGHIAQAENGVPTRQAFFTEAVAREIVADEGKADVITTTSVFAHMATLGEVMRGICALLADRGMFVIETHYLLNVLAENQFDTVYHEHLRTYSLKSLCALFPQYGMEVFHAERTNRYGGDLRAWVGWKGAHAVTGDVDTMLKAEDDAGLHYPATWLTWRADVLAQRNRLMQFLYRMRDEGRRVAGVSCPGRCSTLLNFYGIGPDLIQYLGELPNSLKLGKFLPGRHIPIISNQAFHDPATAPDVLVLMAWHYGRQIVDRLRKEGLRQDIVYPLPTFKIDRAV
jgi:hypothetical protein